MSKSRIRAKNQPKTEKKSENSVVSEKKAEMKAFPKKERLDKEFFDRKVKLTMFVESCQFSLSDCEKLLGMAYDCRNTARKLHNFENGLIIS